MKNKAISLILTGMLAVSMLAGCGPKEQTAAQGSQSAEPSAPAASEEAQTSEPAADAGTNAGTDAGTDAGTASAELIGNGAVTYDPSAPVNNGEDITITFWYDDPGPEGYQRYARAIADYQELHPNVTIEVNNSLGWGDYWSKLPVAVASGTGPDLMHFHLNWYGDFIPELAEPYPEDLAQALIKDFRGVEPMIYEGKVYTIPVGDMTGAIFYNKEMWKEAGLTEADIPQTWDELREVAKKLTKTEGDKIVVNGMDIPDGYFLLALNYQKGYNVFAEDGKHTQMDNPGALEAAQMLQGFITEDKIFAPGSGSSQERFGNKQSAMMYNWTWAGGWLEGNVGDSFEWGVFPTPVFGEETKVVDRNNPEVSAVVNAKSSPENKAVAMDFLRFYFANDSYLVELADKTYTAPTKITRAEDPVIAENEVVATISSYIDKTVWTGICTSGFDATVSQILADELFIQGKDAKTTLQKFDEENAKLAEEALLETAERKSSLAQYLK